MILKCDVLIIGAGPAGASLAFFLAGEGIDTILIDKKSEIDNPVRCAEYVPAAIGRLFGGPISGLSCSIVSMDTYIDYKYANSIPSPGFMLDRPVFLKSLIDGFRENGGKFLPGTKAVSFDDGYGGGCKPGSGKPDIRQRDRQNNGPGMVTTAVQGPRGKRSVVKSRIAVGADGPNSIVGKYIGSTNSSYISGLGENIPVEAKDKDRTLIFFSPGIEGGYGWLFPKAGSTNLGIGCQFAQKGRNHSMALKEIYMDFKKKLFLMDLFDLSGNQSNKSKKSDHIRPDGLTGVLSQPVQSGLAAGLIPASGMLKKTVSGSFILAGDAAGLANPITGAGIYNAVSSSKIISGIAVRALKDSDVESLADIEKQYLDTFGRSLQKAASKREELMDSWPDSCGFGTQGDSSFDMLIRRCWVSFKDYWRP